MNSTFFSALGGGLTGSSISMLLLLAKATLILLVALGITLTMQRASAGARHLVWLVTLAALLLVPGLTAWGPIPLRVLPPKAKSVSTVKSPAAVPTGVVEKIGKSGVTGPSASPANASPAGTIGGGIAASPVLSVLSILLLVWAAVLLVIAASLGYATLMVHRIVNRARPLDSADWLSPLFEVSDRLALEEPPRLLRSEDAKMPFACGVFRATIVLPAECDSWSLDRRRAVLLHELAHVRRHDLIGHTLSRFACAIYWFHPLVWTAAKQLRSESERACDDLALACGARAADYAEHLLDIVTSVRRDATPSVALAMARRKEFEGRMLAILDPELRHSSPSRKQSAALIGSLALISIVVGAAAPSPRAHPEHAPSPANTAEGIELLNSRTSDTKGYPDSREIIGGSKTHQKTEMVMSQNTQTVMSQNTQTLTGTHTNQIEQSFAKVVEQAVKQGTSAASNALVQLAHGGSKAAGKDTDERPTLLARILATDTSPSLRRIAAWGLAEYADNQIAAEALAKALGHDSDPTVREMAAWALAEGNHRSIAVDALSTAVRGDANAQVRATAAWALGSVGDRSSADALAAALSDASPEVRKRAAWALGSSDLKQAPPKLIAMLSDKDPEVRELAAWALYEIEDPAAIPALESALAREQDKEMQINYIRALAATGEKSVEALKGLLESKDPEIRSIAVRALAGGNATGPWPRPWPEPRPFPN
jgi:beta-lactamase regulating signal transducer with metallopeptidase domain/HEAT repeat protein